MIATCGGPVRSARGVFTELWEPRQQRV